MGAFGCADAKKHLTTYAENQDSRNLTEQEIRTFLPLICVEQSRGSEGYEDRCKRLVAYPVRKVAGSQNILTLTSIIYGHMTNAEAMQAYVSYGADFEPHSNEFGGGISFEKRATGWILIGWYPGYVMNYCLTLSPIGQAKMLCLDSFEDQGELNTALWFATVAPVYDPDTNKPRFTVSVLGGLDDRGSGGSNTNCYGRTTGQAMLLSIDRLTRSRDLGVFANASITYVAPDDVNAFCTGDGSETVRTHGATLRLRWDGKTMSVSSPYKFVPIGF